MGRKGTNLKAAGETVQMDGMAGKLVEVTCSFCRGKGTDPFGIMSWLSACCVCGGGGVVPVTASHRRCAYCRGTGAIKTFTCTVCRGTGFVPLVPGPLFACPKCGGRGDDAASALACLTCRGRGWVPQASGGQGRGEAGVLMNPGPGRPGPIY